MSPIDRETALLLMRNLSANLMCNRMWEAGAYTRPLFSST
jgi:hypothetical protein